LVDFWGASNLSEIALVESTLREAAEACGATVLHVHVHEFASNGGVSGVAVLAESHISIHTWPELDFAAFDIFMCGNCAPENAMPVLRRAFRPLRESVSEQKRGLIE
jgi:S-adenosylmethionine decarboxylase